MVGLPRPLDPRQDDSCGPAAARRLLGALLALTLVAAAPAGAKTRRYRDRVGDAGGRVDLRWVDVRVGVERVSWTIRAVRPFGTASAPCLAMSDRAARQIAQDDWAYCGHRKVESKAPIDMSVTRPDRRTIVYRVPRYTFTSPAVSWTIVVFGDRLPNVGPDDTTSTPHVVERL